MAGKGEDRAEEALRRQSRMEADRSVWEGHWTEVAERVLPRQRDFNSKRTGGEKLNEKIFAFRYQKYFGVTAHDLGGRAMPYMGLGTDKPATPFHLTGAVGLEQRFERASVKLAPGEELPPYYLGGQSYYGPTSKGVTTVEMAGLRVDVTDPTRGDEDAVVTISTRQGGRTSNALHVGRGVYLRGFGGVELEDMGEGTINVGGLFINNELALGSDPDAAGPVTVGEDEGVTSKVKELMAKATMPAGDRSDHKVRGVDVFIHAGGDDALAAQAAGPVASVQAKFGQHVKAALDAGDGLIHGLDYYVYFATVTRDGAQGALTLIGHGLFQGADWSADVDGAGKPADNATKNRHWKQPDDPTTPAGGGYTVVDGEMWTDTFVAPHQHKMWLAGGWTVVAKDGANWTTDVSGTGKPADNADVTGANYSKGHLVDASSPTTAPNPSVYRAAGVRITFELKANNSIGSPGPSSVNGILETKVPSASLADQCVQFFDSVDGRFKRKGASDDSAWLSWKRVYDQDNKPRLGASGDILDSTGANIGDDDVITGRGFSKGAKVSFMGPTSDFAPSVYRALGAITIPEQKNRSAISAPGSATIGELVTKVTQTTTGAGTIHQQFTSEDGVYKRRNGSESAWTAWKKIYAEDTPPLTTELPDAKGCSRLDPSDLFDYPVINSGGGTTSLQHGIDPPSLNVKATGAHVVNLSGGSNGDAFYISNHASSVANVVVNGDQSYVLIPGQEGVFIYQSNAPAGFSLRFQRVLCNNNGNLINPAMIKTGSGGVQAWSADLDAVDALSSPATLISRAFQPGRTFYNDDVGHSPIYGTDGPSIRLGGVITSNRSLNLTAGTAVAGSRFHISRVSTGAFGWLVKDAASAATIATLSATNQWCMAEWNGAGFEIIAAGAF